MVIRLHTKRSAPFRPQVRKIFANEFQINMENKGEKNKKSRSIATASLYD
jgi:hypothetical protein